MSNRFVHKIEHKFLWIFLIPIAVITYNLHDHACVASTIRVCSIITYMSIVIRQFFKQGRKIEGGVGIICAFFLNLSVLVPIRITGCHSEPNLMEQFFAEIINLVVFIMWLTSSILAIKSKERPNYTIGLLSLLLAVTPGVLGCLDHFQYLVYSLFGIEWWHIRPFNYLMQMLWYYD
jgi:hypothetical protein